MRFALFMAASVMALVAAAAHHQGDVLAGLGIVDRMDAWNQSDERLAPEPPRQGLVRNEPIIDRKNGSSIVQRASFRVRGLVLSTRRYSTDQESEFSPLDLALAWGPMSAPSQAEKLSVSQGGRYMQWRFSAGSGLKTGAVSTSTANMHMIPANAEVERALKTVRRGDIVTLEGSLVDVRRPGGWRWRSSLSRSDAGSGACEVVYVESVDIDRPG